jgi:hypothetical protein
MPKIPVNECPAGPAMDAAVAKALGWRNLHWREVDRESNHYAPGGWWGNGPNGECYLDKGYSSDIVAAWKLDRIGWRWQFWETPETLAVTLFTSIEMASDAAWESPRLPEGTIVVQNRWEDSESKVDAYALGRCRAFLKANGVEFVEVLE